MGHFAHMDITKDDIKAWLKRFGRSREWLGEQCGGLSLKAVNNWLSTDRQVPPSALQVIRRLMADDELAEKQRQQDSEPQSHIVLKVDVAEFNAWEDIAIRKDPPQTVTGYCLAAIRAAFQAETGSLAVHAPEPPENLVAFPEIPLLHAAAGSPITTDGETFAPTRDYGPGRFACQLHGDSMAPRFPDGSIVILRERASLKRPVLKTGEIYLFHVGGEKTLKTYTSRKATAAEIEAGISYRSTKDGEPKVRLLKSINPAYPEIVVTEDVDWIGWLDKGDNA